MGIIKLLLFPYSKESQEFELHPHSLEASIVDMLQPTKNYVFNNYEYRAKLECESPRVISDFRLFLNGSLLTTEYNPSDGNITIRNEVYGTKPFLECYGYVQLTVAFSVEGENFSYDTNYIPVMVQKGKQNDSVRRMTEYISKYDDSLLFSKYPLPKNAAGLKENARKTVESRILLLKDISRVFEMNYAYFKANSRFRTVQAEHIDRFEKLQYISSNTIRYILQHPVELKQASTSVGIKFGNRSYQPDRALITNNVQSFDIYENRQIIGFLQTLLGEIKKVQREINALIDSVPTFPDESGDYVASAYFLFVNTVETLKAMLVDLSILEKQFMSLTSAYSTIFKIEGKGDRVISSPRPTPVFLSIPQYRQLYDCMNNWFKMGVVNLTEEKFMLSFLKISDLYEAYVLLKLINYIMDSGFDLQEASPITYQFAQSTFYKNTKCNNKYVFQRNEAIITLYYQPVVYNTDRSKKTGIGLYRNTSISFPRWLGDDSTGGYYAPDYLVKIETPDEPTHYIIADAKFMTIKNVKTYQVAALVYKYLFSFSPVNSTDEIVALYIVNGQSDKDVDSVVDIYDYSLRPGSITPCAEIITLTENSEETQENHLKLLKATFGRHF